MIVNIEIATLGEYLNFLRIKKKLTIEAISKKTGLSPSTILYAERRDNSRCTFATIAILLAFHNITLDSIKEYIYENKKK